MKNVFDFLDYKQFLLEMESSGLIVDKGFRSRIAEILKCQNAFVSQVLNGQAHFSQEQCLKISKYLNLGALENKYFLNLNLFSRAGTAELKQYYKLECHALKEAQLDISLRDKSSGKISEQDQNKYYSSWIYSAVHMATTIPALRNASLIADFLGVDESQVKEVVRFLIQKGILIEQNGKLQGGSVQLHLEKNSPLVKSHHSNWRIVALEKLQNLSDKNFHYSTVSSMSAQDVENIRSMITKLVDNYVETVKPSREERLCFFNIDFCEFNEK